MKAAWPVLACVLLAGCGAPEPLPPKSAMVPVGINLSGQWRLRADSGDTSREVSTLERKVTGADDSLVSGSKRRSRRERSADMQVHVFLETGDNLKITQTEYALFVSFDRAVVEEYRFGEQRMVSVGPVEAERVSGWEDDAYVIETRGEEGAMLIESYSLGSDDTLVRSLRIVHKGNEELDVRQVFERR